MSLNPSNARPDEEALAALLMISALVFGSLFTAAKTVTHHVVRSTLKEDERGSNTNELDREPEVTEEQRHVVTDTNRTNSTQNDDSRMEDNKNGDIQHIEAEAQELQLPSTQCNLGGEEDLNAIRAQEDATIGPIQPDRAQRLQFLPSFEQRKTSPKQDRKALPAREQATTGPFQQERVRGMERLSSLGPRIVNQEEDNNREAVHAWEQAAKREVSRREGVEAANAWARATMRRSRQDGREPFPRVGKDERIILWLPRQAYSGGYNGTLLP